MGKAMSGEICLMCGDSVKGSRLLCDICAERAGDQAEPNQWGEIEA